MIPIIPEDGGEPLTFLEGDDFRNPGKEIYKVFYSTEHPTLVTGKTIHSVEKMKDYRVVLRLRTNGETYEDVMKKHDNNQFILKN